MHTPGIFLKIAPQFVAAWVDPHTIRFGFSTAALELSALTEQDRTLISSLLTGTTMAALKRTAKRSKISPEHLQEMLRLLAPVLQASSSPSAATTTVNLFQTASYQLAVPIIASETATRTALLLHEALSWHGHLPSSTSDLLITVNRFLVDQQLSLSQLQHSTAAQLPITFSDSCVRIGPLLTAESTPCAACCEHETLRADPDKSIMLPQLLGHTAATETATVVKHIAPLLAQLVAAPYAATGKQFSFEFSQAEIPLPRVHYLRPDAECLCAHLTASPHSQLAELTTA